MTRETRIRRIIKPAVFAACLMPLAWLVWRAASGDLGANPVESANRHLGDWAIRMLLLSLAVTPVAQITGLSVVMRFRRMLGLFAFAYASLHVANYVIADQFFNWADIWADIVKRTYITVGMLTFLILLPLALTSTKGMIKRLGGKRWRKLHRIIYIAGIGAVIHYTMMVKADLSQPILHAAILFALLAYRFIRKISNSPNAG